MPPQDKPSSQRGILLVEAILSAIVIGVGLVFIGRGLANQLSALRSLDTYETATTLAHNKLLELEGRVVSGHGLNDADRNGQFAPPDGGYWWTLTVVDGPLDDDGALLAKHVTVAVGNQQAAASLIQLSSLWPLEWIPPEWE